MATQNELFSVAGFSEEDNECVDAYKVGNTLILCVTVSLSVQA